MHPPKRLSLSKVSSPNCDYLTAITELNENCRVGEFTEDLQLPCARIVSNFRNVWNPKFEDQTLVSKSGFRRIQLGLAHSVNRPQNGIAINKSRLPKFFTISQIDFEFYKTKEKSVSA